MSSDLVDIEDVLADSGEQDDQPRPPARNWRTRGDFIAVTLIVIAVLIIGLLVWRSSDARHTTVRTGPSSVAELPPVTAMPRSLAEAWRAPSASTRLPVVVDSTVVTGDNGQVAGHDPLTGEVRWSYTRNLPLCTVTAAWSRAVAAYAKGDNCSEVTSLDGVTGERRAQRNGDAEPGTRLLNEGSHVLTTGEKYVEVYRRDDLVRSLEFGTLRAIVNPGKQPRMGCKFSSFAVATGKVALVERCPDDASDRLTVLKPNPEKADEPQVLSSVITGASGARVIAVSTKQVAVAMPSPNRLVVFDAETGTQLSEIPLDLPDGDLAGTPADRVVQTTATATHTYWHTGSRLIALAHDGLAPLWTVEGALGSGSTLGGRLLVPVKDALLVLDQTTGAQLGRIPVNRAGYDGPVHLATAGSVVLEQRGQTLVALR